MLKDKSLFIGIGQAGGNICYEFEKLDYSVLMVNTSLEDLNSLKNAKHKHHIKNGMGSGRDRVYSKQLFSEDIQNIALSIDNMVNDKSIIFVCASSSGGTGAGIMPNMIKLIIDLYPDKLVIGVTVLPDERIESVMACNNCYDTLQELTTIENMGALFVLDNKKNKNKFSINADFAAIIDKLLTLDSFSKSGNLDEAELLTLLSTSNYIIVTKLGKENTSVANIIKSFTNNIYAPIEKDQVITYKGYILTKPINVSELDAELGVGLDTFVGYGASTTLCILSGLSIPSSRINEIFAKVKQHRDLIESNMSTLSSASLTEKPIIFNRPNKTNKIMSQVNSNNTNNRREELLKRIRR